MPLDKKELLEAFKNEVCIIKRTEQEEEELEDFEWYDMSVGFFLAKGASVEMAIDLACEARYTHHYWQGDVKDETSK